MFLRKLLFCVLSMIPISFVAADPSREFSFSDGEQGWSADFTDYPVGQEAFFELAWGWENLPFEIQGFTSYPLTKGLFLSGNNHSDDLFMFAKRQIDGFEPNTLYSLSFSVMIESNVPSGVSMGIGGSPGKSVFFKVGASTEEPKKIALNNYYHLSVDKGNQSNSGANAIVIGDLENPSNEPFDPHYFPKQLETEIPLLVQSDPEGRIWIFLGTDSGFEGITKFYIAKVGLQTHPMN